MIADRSGEPAEKIQHGWTAVENRELEQRLLSLVETAGRSSGQSVEQPSIADKWRQAAEICIRLGRWNEAMEHAERSRAAASETVDEARMAAAENILGVIEFERGNWNEASRRFAAAREHAGVAADPALLVEIESNDGILQSALGEYARAEESYRWAASRFDAIPEDQVGPRLLCNMGIVRAAEGRFDEADELFTRALVECKREHDLLLGSKVMLHRVRLALKRGDLLRAHALATTVDAFCEWFTEPPIQAETALLLGTVEARMENWKGAERSIRSAITSSSEGRAPSLEAEAWAELGEVYARQGRNSEALDAWRTARACYRQLGATAACTRLLGQLENHGGDIQ